MPAKYTITITFPPELRKRVDALAEASRVSRSQFIIQCVHQVIDEQELASRVLGNPAAREGFLRIFSNRDIVKALASEMVGLMDEKQLELFGKQIAPEVFAEPSAKPLPRAKRKKGA